MGLTIFRTLVDQALRLLVRLSQLAAVRVCCDQLSDGRDQIWIKSQGTFISRVGTL